MKDLYVFSMSQFKIMHDTKIFEVNKNKHLKISNVLPTDNFIIVDSIGEQKQINLQGLKTNNFIKVFEFENKIFIELIASNFCSLKNKFKVDNFEIEIFDKSLKIIKEDCYTYFFESAGKNYATKNDENLFIFNEKNLIAFNKNKKVFSIYKTEKIAKNNENIEILCKIPRSNVYFLHFTINLDKNIVNIKKLKNDKTQDKFSLPISFFYLAKNGFSDAKKYLKNDENFNKIISYFSSYENIVEFNNKYFIYNQNEFSPINFSIDGELIVEID